MKILIIAFLSGQISSSIGKDDEILEKYDHCLRNLETVISCIQNLNPTEILVDINPISWKIPLPEKFEGPYEVNNILEQATKLFENQVAGPESIALAPNGDLFTGNSDGTIFRITNDMLYVFAKIDGVRPLGIRYHRDGYILVMADLGLYQIFMNQTVVKVFDVEDITFSDCNERSSIFINDFDILYGEGSNGGDVIYFSDITGKWPLSQFIYAVIEPDTTGRLIKYDINAKTFTIIKKDIWFPNGVQLNDAKNALIVSEMTKRRILKVYIKGPNKGKTQVLLSGLPGEPDNIRRGLSPNETYWVALNFVRNASNPLISDILSEDPVNRKLLIRATILTGTIMSYIGKLTNFSPLIDIGGKMVSGEFLIPFYDLPGMAIEFDSNGKILQILQSPNNIFHSISQVTEVKNLNNIRTLYFGSAFNTYAGKCVLSDGKCI